MLAQVHSFVLQGIDAIACEIEVIWLSIATKHKIHT